MEYVENGNLPKYLTHPFLEEEAKMIADQLADGLNHMHQNGFAHRDLKPGSILVVSKGPQWLVQISDLDISKRLRPEQATLGTMRMGTLGFIAPEMLGFISNRDYPYAADIWSLGTVIFLILTNELFLADLNLKRNYAVDVISFPVERLAPFQVNESIIELLEQLLAPNPQKRPSASQVMHHDCLLDVAGNSDESDNSEREDHNSSTITDSENNSFGEETGNVPSAVWSTDTVSERAATIDSV
ncbi:calcium calmodulin-dependent protein kinase type 1b [Colletotrichum tofieldiae]|nr:calcium calmodulin-dependent protein kinase type 1b [Colletotrichum tofieldiae]